MRKTISSALWTTVFMLLIIGTLLMYNPSASRLSMRIGELIFDYMVSKVRWTVVFLKTIFLIMAALVAGAVIIIGLLYYMNKPSALKERISVRSQACAENENSDGCLSDKQLIRNIVIKSSRDAGINTDELIFAASIISTSYEDKGYQRCFNLLTITVGKIYEDEESFKLKAEYACGDENSALKTLRPKMVEEFRDFGISK